MSSIARVTSSASIFRADAFAAPVCFEPEVRGSELKLDTAKLAEKERRDRAKLKMVIDFAYSRACRQQTILRYFGETDPPRCGNCDICNDTAGPARAPTEAEALIVRKALSGVARMSRRSAEGWQAQFGRGRIVQTLVGSRSREIIDARLDQLSTYGLLKTEGVAYLNEIMREFQDSGMVTSTGGQYPTITLTPRGEEIMKGATDYVLRWPQRSMSVSKNASRKTKPKSAHAAELLPVDTALFDRLKTASPDAWRASMEICPLIRFFPTKRCVLSRA